MCIKISFRWKFEQISQKNVVCYKYKKKFFVKTLNIIKKRPCIYLTLTLLEKQYHSVSKISKFKFISRERTLNVTTLIFEMQLTDMRKYQD